MKFMKILNPPKQGEVNGKEVKKQQVDKLLGKEEKIVLDKLTKTVYNIRKDAREVQDVWFKYIYQPHRVELDNRDGYRHYLHQGIIQKVSLVEEICNKHNLPKPVLAGGSLRDLFWNCTPKDYDFFWNFSTEDEAYEFIDQLTLALQEHGGYTEGGPNSAYDDEADFEGIYGVFNFGIFCQAIVGVWPDSNDHIYNRFDLSVCQAEMKLDGEFNINVSEAFLDTVFTKVLKNFRPESAYSVKRAERNTYNLQLKNNNKEKDYYLKAPKWITVSEYKL